VDSEPRTLSSGIPILRIYTATHCNSCRESRRLAKSIGRRLPQLTVEVWDIDHQQPVDDIFAIPTFWYRGRVISLGNPSEDELCERILASEREHGDPSSLPLEGGSTASIPDRSRQRAGSRKRSILAPICGVAGIGGTILCSSIMLATLGGAFALPSSQALGSRAELANAPGWVAAVMHSGQQILILSVLLIVVSAAVRSPKGTVPTLVGGLLLYFGMYDQSDSAVTIATTLAGILFLLLGYASVLKPQLATRVRQLRI